jgi:phospholipid/cholesterol/gamma-HCH transport system permease protein
MKQQAIASQQILRVSGEISFSSIPVLDKQVKDILKSGQIVSFDISEVTSLDSAGVAYLEELGERINSKIDTVTPLDIPTHLAPVFRIFSSGSIPEVRTPYKSGFFESIGAKFISAMQNFYLALVMAADIFYWSIVGLFDFGGQRKGSFAQQGYILGVQALPVVGLLSLIIGFIISLQSAAQLRDFGANVYLADLISVSMVREMGPMMTAIIIAGRSGSAIASEIASMQVSEEIDALRMMAINPIRYVVVPKFHAISIVMPVLVSFSILIGIFGGLMVAVGYLDLSVSTFVARAIDILTLKDIIISLCKSTFFAWVIVIIGSHFGFSVKGGAEDVGRATTNSVVVSIFAVILFDAVFSLLYL